MKYKVKITNLSFDLEFIPEDQPPVIVEPPIIIDPPIPDPDNLDFDGLIENTSGIVRLPSWTDNKLIVVDSKGLLDYLADGMIGNNVIIQVGKTWNECPDQILLGKDQSFFFKGVTLVAPLDYPSRTGLNSKSIFGWKKDQVIKGFFGYFNNQQMPPERITFGLSFMVYSSDLENERIYLIAKNIFHNGITFTQTKNPYKGNLWNIWNNVTLYNAIAPYRTKTSIYTPTDFGMDVLLYFNSILIQSNNSFDQVLTWHGYHQDNIRCIFNIGRFVFDMNQNNIQDPKTMLLESIKDGQKFSYEIGVDGWIYSGDELHAGDLTSIGKIVSKQFDYRKNTNGSFIPNTKWAYQIEGNLTPSIGVHFATMLRSSFDKSSFQKGEIEGTYRAGIVFKNGALFGEFGVREDTRFWDNKIIESNGFGWTYYNNEMSGNFNNVKTTSVDENGKDNSGYCRNSGGGITQGLTIIHSDIKQNPPVATSNNPIPFEAQEWIEYVESL
jgi:hypothetical protein